MSEIIEVEFHSKELTDFQLCRLGQASIRKYSVPVTAFVSDAFIADDTCLGVSFDHVGQGDAFRPADGGLLRTGKIQRAWKEGRYWLLESQTGNYVLCSFLRDFGRRSFRELLRSGERC
ncbi:MULTISPECIES: hypothetical protein [unclassified Pseudomonas]|uniref:hypothetical protein n=1 Tax=unclassified Pseudomonas TaxID=196821 RepID=UPI0003432B13|nr:MULTISPECIES: hypothetical protein [unclassified Pseudomonas]MBT9570934.1 hypothetical protein [Pseudomonas umsongensis]MDP9690639.1 hypothetical protein [Pseudomonas mohnii]EPA96857.1 hypothetical protein PG5_27860 [Pseudomonas sp. G5(2012)]PMZ91132.1 hypothetical protein C1X61_06030 [Pseudomonas sp. FW215-T2]PNA15834.1 hypothetical protein C1X62_04150 [Pseudomonas sp. FW215-R3]